VTRRTRDQQRSKVYAWERTCVGRLGNASIYAAEFSTLEECAAFASGVWRKERGRFGIARKVAPAIERPHRGQRRAYAHADHRITLPRWARSRWVILHELAHHLTPGEQHGPRFVGALMGLACRWLDYDAQQLMQLADELGVEYYVRSIGVVPVHGASWHVERAVRRHGAMTEMELACHISLMDGIDIRPPQVRGAALHLIRIGRARWLRRKLVLLEEPSSPSAVRACVAASTN